MEWIRGSRIGQGSSATVSLATFRGSGEVLAVKSAELQRSDPLQHEQRIISFLCCPNIVSYKSCGITRENGKLMYNLFMEYLPRGTLTDQVRKHGGKLDDPVIARYTRDILRGIDYLHSRGLVHCDVKGRNVLIGEDGAKLADFGCAKSAEDVGMCRGTPAFMAPEVARGEEQGKPADIWALGCTVIEMATGRPQLGDNGGDPLSVLYRIGFSDVPAEIPGCLSEEAKDFLEKCLRRNPMDRWNTCQLQGHPFLAEATCSGLVPGSDSNSKSPTSILDTGFWNLVETEPETTISSGQFTQPRHDQDSAVGIIIKQLANGPGHIPSWMDFAEDWITVRGDDGGNDVDRPNNDIGIGNWSCR